MSYNNTVKPLIHGHFFRTFLQRCNDLSRNSFKKSSLQQTLSTRHFSVPDWISPLKNKLGWSWKEILWNSPFSRQARNQEFFRVGEFYQTTSINIHLQHEKPPPPPPSSYVPGEIKPRYVLLFMHFQKHSNFQVSLFPIFFFQQIYIFGNQIIFAQVL